MVVRPHYCLLSQYSINTELVCTFIGCRITNIKNIYKPKNHLCDSSQAPSAGLQIGVVGRIALSISTENLQSYKPEDEQTRSTP